jgi:hypothetical protein
MWGNNETSHSLHHLVVPVASNEQILSKMVLISMKDRLKFPFWDRFQTFFFALSGEPTNHPPVPDRRPGTPLSDAWHDVFEDEDAPFNNVVVNVVSDFICLQ